MSVRSKPKPSRTTPPPDSSNDPVLAYAQAVVAKTITAGPWVRLACQRHLDDLIHGPGRGLQWSLPLAMRAISFFGEVLKLNGGEFEGRPFVLLPWQAFCVGSLFGWLNADGFRRFRTAYLEIGKGAGKALALDTPIATPEGWSTMGALQVGSRVFDDQGTPCNVTAVTPVMTGRPCYRVEFSDGAVIVADADHQWKTAKVRSGYGIRTTSEIAETLVSWRGEWIHRVDCAPPLQLPDGKSLIAPFASAGKPAIEAPSRGRMIVACDRITSVSVRCIEVDSASHLFLAGSFLVPTHNSPLAAGIGLYCLCSDNESRAEVYAAATKKEQAMVLFRDAVAMVDLSPDLKSRLVKTGGRQCWNLGYSRTSSFFRAIASDDGQSGPRPHCSLIDELHEHPNGNVCDMLQAGQKFRRQPLTIKITNAGYDRETVCFRDHEYSTRVVSGVDINDEWFGYICALDESDQPIGTSEDPFSGRACWIKTNPSLGVTIRNDYIEGQIRSALGMPGLLSLVRRLNFCEWVDAAHPWIEGHLWMKCEAEFDALAELKACDEVVGALDLSGTRDLTALSLVGRRADGMIISRTEYWTPGDTLHDRARADKVPYDIWEKAGFVNAPPGRGVDYSFVAARLAELTAQLPLYRVCFDPYRIAYLEPEIDATGAEIELIAHPQGGYKTQPKLDKYGAPIPSLWMPRSIELLEKAVSDGRLRVQKNPCLTWNSASAVLVATDDKGNLIFSKRKSRGRIDGIVTLAMAVGLLEASNGDNAMESLLEGEAIT